MKTVLALMTALAALPAAAHNLWLEPAGDGALHLRYGEPEIRVLERSPGKLDALEPPRAQALVPGSGALLWRRAEDGFVLRGPGPGEDTVVEARAAGMPSRYYARHAAWPLKAARPVMALDIVPTAEAGTFAVFFKGAPLTRGTLKVIAPSLWLQVHDIDERGRVRIHTPWRGLYVLDVDTREAAPDSAAGPQQDAVPHRATLSFTTPEGPAFERPLPAQFAAH